MQDTPDAGNLRSLSEVACSSPDACTAVGFTCWATVCFGFQQSQAGKQDYTTLAQVWDGSAWTGLRMNSGNGMSEACFMFFLVLSARALLRWLADGRPQSLVPLGLSLGLAGYALAGERREALYSV